MGNSSVTFTRTKKLLGNVRLAFGVGEDDLHNFAQAAKARRTNLHNLCEINSLESDTTRRAHSCSPETISPCKIQGFDIRPTPRGIDLRFSNTEWCLACNVIAERCAAPRAPVGTAYPSPPWLARVRRWRWWSNISAVETAVQNTAPHPATNRILAKPTSLLA